MLASSYLMIVSVERFSEVIACRECDATRSRIVDHSRCIDPS
jgi:hypothetical protein